MHCLFMIHVSIWHSKYFHFLIICVKEQICHCVIIIYFVKMMTLLHISCFNNNCCCNYLFINNIMSIVTLSSNIVFQTKIYVSQSEKYNYTCHAETIITWLNSINKYFFLYKYIQRKFDILILSVSAYYVWDYELLE